jgi:hypothetical protein
LRMPLKRGRRRMLRLVIWAWPVIGDGSGRLVPQGEDLDVFVPVAHGEQAEQGEGVGQAEVGQSR